MALARIWSTARLSKRAAPLITIKIAQHLTNEGFKQLTSWEHSARVLTFLGALCPGALCPEFV